MSFKGLTIGVSGLESQAKKMEVIGNNLANINTTGFKSASVQFAELFHQTYKQGSAGDGNLIGGTNAMTIGSGVTVSSITNIFTQGSRQATTRALDFMIEGDDFFVAQNAANGSLMLTRNGNFQLDGTMTLVDSMGNKVMGFNVDKETGEVDATAGAVKIDSTALAPTATTQIKMNNNIDKSLVENNADMYTNGWELFSGGENFGSMNISTLGGTGSRNTYGSGYYLDGYVYEDSAASVDAGLTTITLSGATSDLINGFSAGDVVSLSQGTEQVKRIVSSVDTGAGTITLTTALSSGFTDASTLSITNLSEGTQARGSSGTGMAHNDVLRSQISMVDADGNLIASFYRVSGTPANYSRATATLQDNSEITVGMGEFTDMKSLKEAIELALRDNKLTNYGASNDLKVDLDKYGKLSFSGTGMVEDFRFVVNADNTEMLDRFDGFAITDNAATATTQARTDANGKVITTPALGLGARSATATKAWFATAGLENYGYSTVSPSSEYGEFAGLRLDGGADGTGYGMLQLSMTNALGDTVTQEFKMVARDPDPNQFEFSTMGELATLLQNTLRSQNFSSVADNGVLDADGTASVNFVNGRLNVSTTNGVFKNLSITAMNTTPDVDSGVQRTDEMNFGTVLGALSQGINGKSGQSNKFIEADVTSQTRIYDSVGNEHTVQNYFVRDRSSGLTNIEWKFRTALNPNLNSFAQADLNSNDIYGDTFNTVQDTLSSHGVIAFDIATGDVLGENSPDSESRYVKSSTLIFTPLGASQEADTSQIEIDFSSLTSFNGDNTVSGTNVDGNPMGNLVRIVTESNTGAINGVYSNGKIKTLAKVGLMSIANPEGLEKIGSSYFVQTPNSSEESNAKGIDQIFAVGAQGIKSKVHGNSLEGSNVDLSGELTDMIVTQRSYSASGKIITTSDDMLQEALSLKR